MSYQLSTENGAAAMDVTKLQAAIQKQDEYLSSRGHLSDVPAGDENFNDLTREIIRAFKECHGSAFLGKLVFSWEDQKKLERGEIGIYTEYTGQSLPAYGCNFVTAQPDTQLEAMVIGWTIDEWPPKFTLFTKILQRIQDLNGYTLNWIYHICPICYCQ